jgi:small GTP-binding protein
VSLSVSSLIDFTFSGNFDRFIVLRTPKSTVLDFSMSGHKVVFLGSEGVGKTSIINRFTTNTFSLHAQSTLGVAHRTSTVEVRGTPVDLVIWDTAGQEQFGALVPMYCRSARVGIIVLSVVNPESIEAVPMWKDRLYECGNHPPIVIAINKTDLCEQTPAKIEEVKTLLSQWEHVYCVSALTGDCVDQLFVQVGALALEHTQADTVQAPKPKTDEAEGCGC